MNTSVQFDILVSRVQIHLPDKRVLTGPRGATLQTFLQPLAEEGGTQIVGAVINGELKELTTMIEIDSVVIPKRMDTSVGMKIYRRSLTFLLESAFKELFPDGEIKVDHSVSFGGYYYQVKGREVLNEEELKQLKTRMKEIVQLDLPLEKKVILFDEAIAHFEQKNQDDKLLLHKHRKKDYLIFDCLGNHCDYHEGYMVPSTGFLKWFNLELVKGGLILRFPRRHQPEAILPLGTYPKLQDAYRQYGNWLELLGFQSVGALNDAISEGRTQEVILFSEALHEQRIADIASQIAAKKDELRLVLIAGPSSSGKTTTARRLSIHLLAHGIQTYPMEMDNYFVDIEKTPRDEHGNYDFDHINALDKAQFNQDLNKLIAAEKVQLPKYNFYTGKSESGEVVKLKQGQIIIVEGIHGLNTELVKDIHQNQVFRVYISALPQLNLDRHNRVSTTDTRLIRRIVRDARTRGYTAQDTISRWESVKRGEKRYIFPYQENADIIFNSALVYELSALKSLAEPLLRQIPFGTPEHIEAQHLLVLLEWFLPIDTERIPNNSLLCEFIGGSFLQDFKPSTLGRK